MKILIGIVCLVLGIVFGGLFIVQIPRFINDFNNLSEATAYQQGYFVGGVLFLVLLSLISMGLILTGIYLTRSKPQSTIDN